MKNSFIFIFCLIVLSETRDERQLVYVNGGVFKFIIGVSIPLDVGLKGRTFGWFGNIQGLYKLPDNITYFQPYKVVQKRFIKNTLVRNNIYAALEKNAIRSGVGTKCLLRKICEINQLDIVFGKKNKVLGSIIHLLFSPLKDDSSLAQYKQAQMEGVYRSHCDQIYQNCSTIDYLFSTF